MANPPFNDAPTKPLQASQATVTSGSKTTGFDPFRQGVELTQDRYIYGGIYKIWSGETNQQIPPTVFGQVRIPINDDIPYVDIETYQVDAKKFLSASTPSTASVNVIASQYLDFGQSFDGVLEPLVIRPRNGFFRSELTFDAHTVKGQFSSGNKTLVGSSDRILPIQPIVGQNPATAPFSDMVTLKQAIPNLPPRDTVVAPFIDTVAPRGLLLGPNADIGLLPTTSSLDASILNAMGTMSSSSDTYVRANYKASTSGFTFDAYLGTDSLAFGDRLYRSLLSSAGVYSLPSAYPNLLWWVLGSVETGSPTVTAWPDQSGNANNWSTYPDAHKPQTGVTIGGQAALDFSNTPVAAQNTGVSGANFAYLSFINLSIFFVLNVQSVTANYARLVEHDANNSFNLSTDATRAKYQFIMDITDSGVGSPLYGNCIGGSVTIGTPQIVSAVFSSPGSGQFGTATLYVNGTSVSSVAGVFKAPTSGGSAAMIMCQDSTGGGNLNLGAYVAEAFLYTDAKAGSNLLNIHRYLGQKYGIIVP